ncbi:hypothetical protein pb186bvf_009860 [Paramecium bursaria]
MRYQIIQSQIYFLSVFMMKNQTKEQNCFQNSFAILKEIVVSIKMIQNSQCKKILSVKNKPIASQMYLKFKKNIKQMIIQENLQKLQQMSIEQDIKIEQYMKFEFYEFILKNQKKNSGKTKLEQQIESVSEIKHKPIAVKPKIQNQKKPIQVKGLKLVKPKQQRQRKGPKLPIIPVIPIIPIDEIDPQQI